ncbi:Serine/threonine protein kinase [Stigmatella aurantiaca]|uniref:Serine/threonine protein kinase n=1 Tax=Stigmatella aurantiaca TaxID=41 RepID=A0A1H7QS92_STIAU|nr:serine/threonine-protein kinase [Stigmatella aurantiaca]SEL50860.1 Serine/threonine protein kinase [Stigmatella aurantiaca]
MTLQPFGSYELLNRFGLSGTSELWFALPKQRRGINRPLLLKRILPHLAGDHRAAELFLQEAKLGASLQHPNIVRIFDFGEVQGIHYIAREFVHGKDLHSVQRLARRRTSVLTHERALRIISSVCEALAYAYHHVDHLCHPLKRVHGELAMRHILIGNDGAVKVIGFGSGKVTDPQLLMRGGIIPGRFDSMAPEQIMGKAMDHRTDLFTAGLVLYELLTGVRPLKRESDVETARATLECQIPPPSQMAQVPTALDGIVMKALARAPDDRYQDPRDFQLALEAYLTAQWAEPGSESLTAMMWRLSKDKDES